MNPVSMVDPAVARRFGAALVVSLFIILGGIVWTWRVGQQSNSIYHKLAHTTEGLEDLRRVVKQQEARRP